jgi:hypothetical protein
VESSISTKFIAALLCISTITYTTSVVLHSIDIVEQACLN